MWLRPVPDVMVVGDRKERADRLRAEIADCIDDGRLVDAVDKADEVLELVPGDAVALGYKGMAYTSMADDLITESNSPGISEEMIECQMDLAEKYLREAMSCLTAALTDTGDPQMTGATPLRDSFESATYKCIWNMSVYGMTDILNDFLDEDTAGTILTSPGARLIGGACLLYTDPDDFDPDGAIIESLIMPPTQSVGLEVTQVTSEFMESVAADNHDLFNRRKNTYLKFWMETGSYISIGDADAAHRIGIAREGMKLESPIRDLDAILEDLIISVTMPLNPPMVCANSRECLRILDDPAWEDEMDPGYMRSFRLYFSKIREASSFMDPMTESDGLDCLLYWKRNGWEFNGRPLFRDGVTQKDIGDLCFVHGDYDIRAIDDCVRRLKSFYRDFTMPYFRNLTSARDRW